MKTKKKLLRYLSVFLACVMFLNAPMSAMAFEDISVMDVIAEDAEMMMADEDSADTAAGNEEAVISEEIAEFEEVELINEDCTGEKDCLTDSATDTVTEDTVSGVEPTSGTEEITFGEIVIEGIEELSAAEALQLEAELSEEDADTDTDSVTATVSFTAQSAGEFMISPQFALTVSGDTAENYGYTDQTDKASVISTIDVLVAAHAAIYGEDFTSETARDYLISDGNFITKMFGKENGGNVCILVNGLQPGNNGIEQATVTDGDLVELFEYQNAQYLDKYVWLELPDGTKADGQTVYGGKTVTVVVKGYSPYTYGYDGDEGITVISGASVYMVNTTTGELTALNVTAGEDGTASITVPETYEGQSVYLTAKGDEMAMTLAKVQVKTAPVTDACNLTSLELAVGGSTVDTASVQTLTPAFAGDVTAYTTPILDYVSDKNQRFVWVKVSAPEGTTVTAKCGKSNVTALTDGEWGVLQVQGGYSYAPSYSGCLSTGTYNEVIITVSKEEEKDQVYTVTVPMQPDITNQSLAWKTDLAGSHYITKDNGNAVLTVEAQYQNRPLENTDAITYQWYSSEAVSTEGGTAIAGATDASYRPDVTSVGEYYYYVTASCGNLETITSNIMKVTVTDAAAPQSITVVCDHPYTIEDSWINALGGKKYIAKVGESLNLKAVDENGKETPVIWSASLNGGTLANAEGSSNVYTIKNTSYSYIQVTSLYDASVKSEEKAIQVVDYSFSQYNKTPSFTLSSDGQTVPKISTQGGITGYNIWTYETSGDGVATLHSDSDLSKKSNWIYFNALRPGTVNVSFDLDLDGNGVGDGKGLTDSAVLTINGIAVEDADGNLTKTYLEMSSENPAPTMQLQAISSTENAAFTWSSADETVAAVDENGLVTAKGVGSVIISATDGTDTGGIKVVVTSGDTPYFEQIDFTTVTSWNSGLSNATWTTDTFKPTTLAYTGLRLTKAAASTLTLKETTLYDTEKYSAAASYTDANGEERNITIHSGAVTALDNIPFETSVITITLTDKTEETKKNVYTFEITRPRDTTKTIYTGGIVFAPEGREIWTDKYNEKTEGVMYVANEDGSFAQYQGVSSSRLYYRTYAMNGLEAFKLTVKGGSAYTHIRFSTDDGENWTDLGMTGTSGVSTGSIMIPTSADEEHSVVKVMIEILDDVTYAANVAAGNDGFADSTPNRYTVWVEQIPVLSAACDIVTATTDSGDWYPEFASDRTSYRIVTAPDSEAPVLTYTVSEDATVTIGEETQTPDEKGIYTLTLTETSQNLVITAGDGMTSKTYSFGYGKRESIYVPDKVVDFLTVNSQYTNGSGGGYGSSPQQALTGGLLSLGNFGGYVTFYLENGLTDDPTNTYGVDFYVNGNAFKDTSTGSGLGSMEPGQVWVSEDGSTWYALAGSEHYESSTIWDYAVTYKKTETGMTDWSDNQGNTMASTHGRSFAWPSPSVYTMNDLAEQNSFTLTGILLPCADGTITGTDNFSSYSKGGRFGYADLLVNGTANPYLNNSDYSNASSGFDLAWAVDTAGNPVDVSGKSFHYVKVVTASNIIAGAANEKSTEVGSLVRAAGSGSEVGVTAAPSGVTFTNGETSYVFDFEAGTQIYEVTVPKGMTSAAVLVNGTSESDNIYINNQWVASGTASNTFSFSTDSQKLIRIIVQNGEKEPVLYLLKVTESTEEAVVLPKLSSMSFRKSTSASSSEFALTPAFDPVIREYTMVIPDSMSGIAVWATLEETSSGAITANYTNTSSQDKSVKVTSGKTTGASLANLYKSKNLAGNTLTIKIGDETAYTIRIVKQPTLSSLNFTANQEIYELNETFDPLTGAYSALLPPKAEVTVNAATTTSTGVSVLVNGTEAPALTPEWEGRTCDLTITLKAEGAQDGVYTVQLNQTPEKLEIAEKPVKTEYKPGEKFDITGLVLKAVYADSGSEIVENDKISCEPAGAIAQDVTEIILTYDTVKIALPITVIDGFRGNGTAENPFLIESAEDYQKLYDMVASGLSFEGQYLKQMADITLPQNWKPIGTLIDPSVGHINKGNNLHAFSGTLDGNGYTITVPEGGLPLLGYVKGATVKNLNIYGKKIAGYGLVNHLEGVGLSGTAAVIENVTMKSGSSTLKSGLIGTYITTNQYGGCSAGFVVTIRNCIIEKDVVIGYNKDQSQIASFAGRMNGTIENCVSHATVYGVDYVGGILGTRDNALGTCEVRNCEFGGTVAASGSHAGGIVGGGYENSTSPNGNRTTIQNCYVSGDVTGTDKVGGILGSDTYVAQTWSANAIKNNFFTGKVQTTSGNYVGGIIGFYDSLNIYDDITGNYYASGCGAEKGIGAVAYVDTSCTTHETDSETTYFDTTEGTTGCPTVTGCHWKKGLNRADDPLGADADKLCYSDTTAEPVATELVISGDYSTDVVTGGEPDFSGMILTVKYNNDTETNISAEDVRIKGFDAYKLGEQTVTLLYGKVSANVTLKVMNAEDAVVKVTFTLLGDKVHDTEADGEYHTWAAGNLETWIPETEYEFKGNATVLEILERALEENGMTYRNEAGNYVQGITRNGVELAEFTNGAYTGWMYKLNGKDSDLSVIQQYLKDGDAIVFHYSDYYPDDSVIGTDSETEGNKVDTAIIKLPSAQYLTLEDQAAVAAARAAYEALSAEEKAKVSQATLNKLIAAEAKIAELQKEEEEAQKPHVHSWDAGTVTKAATCKETGVKTFKCSCGQTRTETIALSTTHKYGTWTTESEATVKSAEIQKHICSVCGKEETQTAGKALTPVLEIPGKLSSFNMKKGKTAKFEVTMANGDSVSSVKSSKTKILKAALDKKTGKITVKGLKKGTSKLTITLESGKSRTYTVKVVTGTVRTKGLSVTNVTGRKLTLAVKKTHTLQSELKPFTSTQKVAYKSSNKKIVKVSAKGKVTAVAPGKATITVKSGSKKVKISVTVPGITNVKSAVSVKKNKTLTLKPKTYGISGKVTYTSSNTKVAAVTSAGKIKGIRKGTAKITIKAGTYTKTVKVTVK